jgi:CTP:molybdopterin cytidylyltransferase MocA
MSLSAILLAAGGSRRLGQPKQLLLLNGETLIARALRLASEAGAAPVFVVLGAYHEIIASSLGANSAIVVVNENWQQGISTSIAAGLRTAAEQARESRGVLLLGCDQPRLSANHLCDLVRAFDERDGEVIVASTYAGARGIPAIFPRAAFPGLLALRADRGARALIENAPCPVVSVQFEGGDLDIDSPQDLEQLG